MAGNDSYTKLLLHFDGDNDSTVFTDSSAIPKSYISRGNTVLKTDQKKFGTASAYFNGGVDYKIRYADHEDFNFGSGDFTIDFWWRHNDRTAGTDITSHWDADGVDSSWRINYSPTSNDQCLRVYYSTDGTNPSSEQMRGPQGSFFTAQEDTWVHIAFVRNGSTMYLFQDGAIMDTHNCGSATLHDCSSSFNIGGYDTHIWGTRGYIDEFRVSKGIARWTEAFTPPTEAYTAPHTLSGQLNSEARVIIFNQSDWSIEDDQVRPAGSWTYNTTDSTKAIVAFKTSDGEGIAYGNLTPAAP